MYMNNLSSKELCKLKFDIKNEILNIISKDIYELKKQMENISAENNSQMTSIEKLVNDNISTINQDIEFFKENFNANSCLSCLCRRKK